jgi:lysophospholipid acyltransferase (LPLAT)-like uncharacterized protein
MKNPRLLAAIASWIVRALLFTLRFRIEDRAGLFDPSRTTPILGAFWHNRLLVIPWIYQKHSPIPAAALTSASRDGEILAGVLASFGVRAVRGSSSRRGVGALIEMKKLVKEGFDIAITPDGPRGPRYELNPGIIKLAQKTGASIIPLNVEYSRFVQVGRWDGFMIPLPFARVDVTIGAPETIPPTTTDEDFEKERLRIQQVLTGMMKSR